MKKFLPLSVVVFLVLSGLGAVASFWDDLDQYQEVMTENYIMPVGQIPVPDNPINIQVAQSFIPTKEILTRVELFLLKNSTASYPYIVAIKDDLMGDELTLTSVNPETIPTEDLDWIEFDFDDIRVNTGQTYYIVSYTENTTDNYYGWGVNNVSESYLFGCMYYSIDDGESWSNKSATSHPSNIEEWYNQGAKPIFDEIPTWDACFRTYGRENTPPSTPTLTGPTSGKPGTSYDYTIEAGDINGDQVYYYIDWGDGEIDDWFGPFDSEDPQTVSHTWDEKGEYTISGKAKDICNEESGWVTLEVSMPRGKLLPNTFFQRLLERFPNAFPVIRHIFGL